MKNPIELVRESDLRTTVETRSLLRVRLRAACWILQLGLLVFFMRGVFGVILSTPSSDAFVSGLTLFQIALILLLSGAIWLLGSSGKLSLGHLRLIEYGSFSLVALLVALNQYQGILFEAGRGDAGLVVAVSRGSMFVYFLLMVVYGLLIPNSGRSAARIVVPLALAPAAVNGLAALTSPEFVQTCSSVATFERFSVSTGLILIGAGTVIYGAHILYSLRQEVQEAKQMGQYKLVQRIGTGGMGEVWKAEHNLLARQAAIKLIRPERVAGAEEGVSAVLSRFEREAQATARLQSPHTVEIYDFGVTEQGVFYYVMELLDGVDLETLVERFGPVSPARAVRLLSQVCDSLAEAHHMGLIHRDVKPANIFACRCALKYDVAKVLDFGLVKERTPAEQGTKLTMAGTVTGTPAFIAPEVAVDGSRADHRSDIYSLGCVAYWLVTGATVFEGSTPMETILQHIKESPVPPSRRVELGVPEALEKVILACLEKEPDDRPQSAMELAARLEGCELEDGWEQEKAADWWKKHLPDQALSAARAG